MASASRFEVVRRLERFLEEEGMTAKKGGIDTCLATNRHIPGSLVPVLQAVQKDLGYLPPVVQDYVALGLNLAPSDVYGVVSFYSFFSMTPRGKHVIRVCMGTACYVKNSAKIMEALEAGLNVKPGETTADRQFTLEAVRCVGACGLAPVVLVDEEAHGQIDPRKSMAVLKPYMNPKPEQATTER